MIDFNRFIEQHIARESRPKGIGKYYPSESGTCMRKAWYSYNFPNEIDPGLRKIFMMGDLVHSFIVDVLKSEKNPEIELIESEMPFKQEIEDFVISGRVDDVVKVKAEGKVYLVEVKSTKGIQFVKEAAPHNIQQLQLYMFFTGIHNGVLLYVDKTNLQTKVFDIAYSEDEAKRIIDRFRTLHKHLKEKMLPEAEARVHKDIGWMCSYCEYKDRCHRDTPTAKHEA